MNSKGEENRSVRLTRKRLSDALITLLMQKPVREITVRELTELANVSRGTFYFHYTDIYDLMDHVEREMFINMGIDYLFYPAAAGGRFHPGSFEGAVQLSGRKRWYLQCIAGHKWGYCVCAPAERRD